MKIAILQRVIPGYRRSLFKSLSNNENHTVKIFIGEDVPNSKVKNNPDLNGINFKKCKTLFFKINKRTLVYHFDLIKNLIEYKPDVIICEGESHFIGYLQAFYYKMFYNKHVKLIHWCFISLPGEDVNNKNIRSYIKSYFRKRFDGFLVYSNYSKNCLLNYGIKESKVHVSVNVGDVVNHMLKSDLITEPKNIIKQKLFSNTNYNVLYLGTLDANKKPDLILEVALLAKNDKINFIILGEGPLQEDLIKTSKVHYLNNVKIPGKITTDLPLYCYASDILIVPGRGGIVISEAMSYKLPVIVHQCDGTEYDLVIDGVTGFILNNSSPNEFYKKIKYLADNPSISNNMGIMGRNTIEKNYNTENMVKAIINACLSFNNQNLN